MSQFFAMLSRMKYISRWGLMRNTRPENLSEHSLEVAFLAHALGVLRNKRFGGRANPERLALLSLFHDVPEIITGDLPTPVKYYNDSIRGVYGEIEENACGFLLSMLPEDLRAEYASLLSPAEEDRELLPLLKAADKISALIKCLEEKSMGNRDFEQAEAATRRTLEEMHLPEADCFLEEFLPAYLLTLDEQKQGGSF